MAAALLRGGRGLCVQCIHRELCRFVWRPQTALLSSKPPGPRKQPRITHIKKAKPQPAVDIPKLLEQLFAQRRPDPAAPVSKASAARASSTKPPATSSVKTATSTSPQSKPPVSVSPAASAFKQTDDVPTKTTPPASPPPDTLPVSQNSVSPPVPKSFADISTKISPSFETTSQSSPPFIGASLAGVVSEMISPITTTLGPPPSTTTPASVEPQVHSIESPAETIEAKLETSIESVELTAAPVPPLPANVVENNAETSEFTTATLEPLIETAIEPTVDALSSPLETLESRTAFAEGTVEPPIEATVDTTAQKVQINKTDSGADASHTALIKNAIESSAMSVEATVEASALSSGTVVGTGAKVGQQQQEEERVGEEAAVEEGLSVAEAMTLESVTLAEVKALVESLPSDVLLHTKSTLDDKADAFVQDSKVQTGSGAECDTAAETENITKLLSERDSLSEDVEALEAETDILMEELLCTIPEAVSKMPASVTTSSAFRATASGPANEASGDSVQGEEEVTEVETLTLESITLAEVEARMGSLETDVLQHTKTTLEEEAAILAKEEKMEQKTVIEDGVMSEETTEAEVLTLDSLSEATDALETETSLVLEAILCAGPGLTLQPDSSLVEQQQVATESAVGGKEEGKVLEAMTLESVTLAEVESLVGTLESEALTETTAQLEQKAEMLAKEEKMEEERTILEDGTLPEEVAEALTVEALSLPEADSLPEALQAETDVLMEELLFSVPGPVGVMTEDLIVQKVVGMDVLNGKETSEERGSGETLGKRRGEETVLNEALTLESLTLSEVETLVETSEMDVLTEAEAHLETETEIPAEEMRTEQKVFSEVAEVHILSEAEILTKADVLGEAAEALEAESGVILQNLLCPVSGIVTITTDATGSVAVDPAAAEPNTLPLSLSAPEEVLGQKEEEADSPPAALEEMETEVGAETETLEIHKGLDPVQRLFLEKIREYNMRRSCEGAVEAGPDFEKRLSEEKAKLQRLYGGGDLSSFPQFTFTEPKLDQDSK